MGQTKYNEENTENPIRSVLVWDLPTRLFHWLLVIFVIISFVTGNIGGNTMQYHDWVGKATSDWLTTVHKLNQQVIIALVGLHVAAVLFYFFYKRQNLVSPMITGVKPWHGAVAEPAGGRTWLAVLITGLAALVVFLLVR